MEVSKTYDEDTDEDTFFSHNHKPTTITNQQSQINNHKSTITNPNSPQSHHTNNHTGGGRGRGGGGRGGGRGGNVGAHASFPPSPPSGGGSADSLISSLRSLDGSPYPKYHSIETSTGWVFPNREGGSNQMTLYITRTQSDPYARPTRVKLTVPPTTAGYESECYSTKRRRTALGGLVGRRMEKACKEMGGDLGGGGGGGGGGRGGGWNGPKGGDVQVGKLGQNVIEQSCCEINEEGFFTIRITVNLPAKGRSIMGGKAADIFSRVLPGLGREGVIRKGGEVRSGGGGLNN